MNLVNNQYIEIESDIIPVTPNEKHEWTITTELVAIGYGVTEETIRSHKRNHSDELIEGKHWAVENINTPGGMQKTIIWTKRGVVRLGFFIRSERAKIFRDRAMIFVEVEK